MASSRDAPADEGGLQWMVDDGQWASRWALGRRLAVRVERYKMEMGGIRQGVCSSSRRNRGHIFGAD